MRDFHADFSSLKIITYLRLCLAKSAEVAPQVGPLEHPCEETPIVGRYLAKLFDEQPKVLNDYLDIIMLFNRATAGTQFP